MPLVLIAIITYMVGVIFMSVYGMAIDTIMLSFLHSEDIAKHKGMQRPAYIPDTLASFFEDYDEKK